MSKAKKVADAKRKKAPLPQDDLEDVNNISISFKLKQGSAKRPLWVVPSFGNQEVNIWNWAEAALASRAAAEAASESDDEDSMEARPTVVCPHPSNVEEETVPSYRARRVRFVAVFVETFAELYNAARDFLVTIAEPLSRPLIVHEYRITPTSLYAAASQGLKSDDVIRALESLAKNDVTAEVKQFIHSRVDRYGKATLVLQKGVFRIMTKSAAFAQTLKGLLAECVLDRIENYEDVEVISEEQGEPDNLGALAGSDWWSRNTRIIKVYCLVVKTDAIEKAREICMKGDFPLMSEYDFRSDEDLRYIPLQLKEDTLNRVRSYQKEALTKIFGNGRARAGLIVLPCGAGKTCVGVVACCTMKKPCIVFCSCSLAAEQWKNQFQYWANINDKHIMKLTSTSKEKYTGEVCIIITTYSMIGHQGQRGRETQAVLNSIRSRIWGLVILDEVHVVPSETFRKAVSSIKYHTAIGLTATLLREDDKIVDLSYLIGPKLYEANWWELVRAGTLARVQCVEVQCQMSKDFYRQYIYSRDEAQRRLIYVMNPHKMQACQSLIEFHEARGDKTLVFSDDILALMTYARALDRPYVYGGTPVKERIRILTQFQHSPTLNTVFISKIGDQAIDLPDASVVIQISAHFGSRRQEAQRLGRILRPKKTLRTKDSIIEALMRKSGETPSQVDRPNAFFYTLVSSSTREVYFAAKRQQFLLDQGYFFKVLDSVHDLGQFPVDKKVYATKESCQELLTMLLVYKAEEDKEAAKDVDNDEERVNSDAENTVNSPLGAPTPKRRRVSLQELSGVGENVFMEYNAENDD